MLLRYYQKCYPSYINNFKARHKQYAVYHIGFKIECHQLDTNIFQHHSLCLKSKKKHISNGYI